MYDLDLCSLSEKETNFFFPVPNTDIPGYSSRVEHFLTFYDMELMNSKDEILNKN